jgi:hypothetical protein
MPKTSKQAATAVPTTQSTLALKYFFSLRADLNAGIGDDVGPTGIRTHVTYESYGSKVQSGDAQYQADWGQPVPEGARNELSRRNADKLPPWCGLFGTVASGGDFVLVRTDGLIQLDGRVTIKAHDDSLVDALYQGSIDLSQHQQQREVAKLRSYDRDASTSTFQAFRDGTYRFANNGKIPVFLSVSFETANLPSVLDSGDNQDLSWVNQRYRATGDNFWRYAPLVRRQFVAKGVLTLDNPQPKRWISAGSIALDFFSVEV